MIKLGENEEFWAFRVISFSLLQWYTKDISRDIPSRVSLCLSVFEPFICVKENT